MDEVTGAMRDHNHMSVTGYTASEMTATGGCGQDSDVA